jgi:hypothetical protein
MVVGDGEGWLTELSTESLREVFALGTEALDDVADDRVEEAVDRA